MGNIPLRAAIGLATLLGVAAIAAAADRIAGWSEGRPAAGMATFGPVDPATAPVVRLPRALAKKVRGRTLLFYFSPDCPHCRKVGPKVAALVKELGNEVRFMPVATSRTSTAQIDEYMTTIRLNAKVFIDADAEVGPGLGLKGIPAAVLLDRHEGHVVELQRWPSFTPHTDRLVRMALSGNPWSELADAEGYLGNDVCGASAHGQAMATLAKTEEHQEVGCVRCHATPTVSGPIPTELGKFRVNEGVGCESCHGPGGDHVEAEGGTDNIVGLGDSCPVCVIEAVCTSCHTATHDKDWDLQRDLARISHKTAAPE